MVKDGVAVEDVVASKACGFSSAVVASEGAVVETVQVAKVRHILPSASVHPPPCNASRSLEDDSGGGLDGDVLDYDTGSAHQPVYCSAEGGAESISRNVIYPCVECDLARGRAGAESCEDAVCVLACGQSSSYEVIGCCAEVDASSGRHAIRGGVVCDMVCPKEVIAGVE